MAHRRSIQRSALSGGIGSLTGTVEKFARAILPPLVFVQQLTSKDTAVIDSQPTTTGRLKTIVNDITGRVTGFNIFQDVPRFQQTMNPSGIWNQYTATGVGALIAGEVINRVGSSMKIPKVSSGGKKIRNIGASVIIPAKVGGFFDAPQASANKERGPLISNGGTTSYNSGSSAGYNTQNYSYSAYQTQSSGGAATPAINGRAF